ncbi:MAG: Lrp/AsnC ligand binding domain-containing protein [candidate division NC10 bacterium]|nr:Lrp/AsnC ligand binding domain-containing protein [candidate division NC10 bacterium]
MAISAYVFIESTPGKAGQVAEAAGKLPGVKMAHAVTGSYDVIAFVEVKDVTLLGEFITSRIHRLPGVLKTTTNVVVGQGGVAYSSRRAAG